jgi:hypothetical protein
MGRRILVVVAALGILVSCSDDDGGSEAEADELTEDWPCGFQLATSNEDQTLGLIVRADDVERLQQEPLPFEDDLVGGVWEATVIRGTDLFANWCDDLIEEGEPTRNVEEELPVTGGRIEITEGPVEEGEEVEAELTDVTAEDPSGETIDLGDVHIENENWGFLAG